MMKFLLTFCLLIGYSSFSFSQELHNNNVFALVKTGSNYTQEFVIQSLVNANWCGYINSVTSYELHFDDGTIVKVKSAQELINDGIEIENSCIRADVIDDQSIYKISENGYVIRLVSKTLSKSQR